MWLLVYGQVWKTKLQKNQKLRNIYYIQFFYQRHNHKWKLQEYWKEELWQKCCNTYALLQVYLIKCTYQLPGVAKSFFILRILRRFMWFLSIFDFLYAIKHLFFTVLCKRKKWNFFRVYCKANYWNAIWNTKY